MWLQFNVTPCVRLIVKWKYVFRMWPLGNNTRAKTHIQVYPLQFTNPHFQWPCLCRLDLFVGSPSPIDDPNSLIQTWKEIYSNRAQLISAEVDRAMNPVAVYGLIVTLFQDISWNVNTNPNRSQSYACIRDRNCWSNKWWNLKEAFKASGYHQ